MLAEELITARATPEALAKVHEALERFWKTMEQTLARPLDSGRRLLFVTAVHEIGTNIIKHAYAPGTTGCMELCLRLYSDRVEALFTDSGVVFADPPMQEIDSSRDLSEIPERGFGLNLARKALDGLYNDRSLSGINTWRLVKFL